MTDTIQIQGDIITTAVRKALETNIAAALDKELVSKLISEILDKEVESTGEWGRSGRQKSGTKKTFVRAAIDDAIERNIFAAVREAILEDNEALRAEIRRLIREKHIDLMKQMAKATLFVAESDGNKVELILRIEDC